MGMPLPWMLGAMIGTTIAALAHLPIAGPDRLRPIVIPAIGVMLGASITPDIFGKAADWAITLLILPLFLACAAGVSYLTYRRLGGYDPVTAFYSAMPGGLNEMLLMGGEAGGDERRIALAHAARVLLVVFFVALYFGFFLGVSSTSGGGSGWIALNVITAWDYLILGLCAVIGVPFARALRLPAAPVSGPMILSGVAHVTGVVLVAPPTLIVIAAQVVMGTVIGSRFIGSTVSSIGRDLGLAAAATLAMLIVAVVFATTIAALIAVPLSQAFLAYAPGGLTEMSLLTLAMGQDVAFVSVTHVIRITLVIAAAPAVFHALRR